MTNPTQRSSLRFDSCHPAFPGHFPGRPIVPGVQLLDQTKRIIESQCGLTLGGIRVAKFLSPAGPGDFLELTYEVNESSVRFAISHGERRVANGQFLLDDGSSS
ncbi:MAG: beta-hydroxyacyl-ACP dehydratase [Ferrovum sp.]|nr:beta-hydroxyacyl-ACP dehydratase [Ferrovum sp.]